jgi:hypothetical protein
LADSRVPFSIVFTAGSSSVAINAIAVFAWHQNGMAFLIRHVPDGKTADNRTNRYPPFIQRRYWDVLLGRPVLLRDHMIRSLLARFFFCKAFRLG